MVYERHHGFVPCYHFSPTLQKQSSVFNQPKQVKYDIFKVYITCDHLNLKRQLPIKINTAFKKIE